MKGSPDRMLKYLQLAVLPVPNNLEAIDKAEEGRRMEGGQSQKLGGKSYKTLGRVASTTMTAVESPAIRLVLAFQVQKFVICSRAYRYLLALALLIQLHVMYGRSSEQ